MDDGDEDEGLASDREGMSAVRRVVQEVRRQQGFVRLGVPACSALVGALGLFWLFERVGWA